MPSPGLPKSGLRRSLDAGPSSRVFRVGDAPVGPAGKSGRDPGDGTGGCGWTVFNAQAMPGCPSEKSTSVSSGIAAANSERQTARLIEDSMNSGTHMGLGTRAGHPSAYVYEKASRC